MICSILLLITLTSCVSAPLVVNVTQSSYQAEENHDVTLEWPFPSLTDRPLDSFIIFCEMFTDIRPSVLFHLHNGVEVSESQDERFAGRVQCDRDVLREGLLRLHVSRLRTDDSGEFQCEVIIDRAVSRRERHLIVTKARVWPEPEESKPASNGVQRGRTGLFYAPVLPAAALLTVCFRLFVHFRLSEPALSSSGGFNRMSSAHGSVETV
ncbi:uncharacterized protein LOC116385666 [Anarrhichthys ocellatus]|uniref:uncharacterized protein LOC116385666 n=1 Tax=Anarrhichthys ocellatus TaxID=433405 RepID=UPI0012ED4F91|nr:uncharacterized protein LOC116385666 [Anarrhichthys ocellatus]